MNTYDVVLYVHLLSLLVGFSAGVVETVCLLRLRVATTLEAAAPWGQLAGEVEKAFPVAILGLFATGAYMTHDVWTWSTSWIVLPICGLVIITLQGPLVAGRRGHAVKAALMANGNGPLGPEARQMTRDRALWAAVMTNTMLVLGIVWVMTLKPAWGGAIAALAVAYAVGLVLAVGLTRAPTIDAAPAPKPAG